MDMRLALAGLFNSLSDHRKMLAEFLGDPAATYRRRVSSVPMSDKEKETAKVRRAKLKNRKRPDMAKANKPLICNTGIANGQGGVVLVKMRHHAGKPENCRREANAFLRRLRSERIQRARQQATIAQQLKGKTIKSIKAS